MSVASRKRKEGSGVEYFVYEIALTYLLVISIGHALARELRWSRICFVINEQGGWARRTHVHMRRSNNNNCRQNKMKGIDN